MFLRRLIQLKTPQYAATSLVAGVPGVVKKTLTSGERPQENNDEVYIADAYAYSQAKIVG